MRRIKGPEPNKTHSFLVSQLSKKRKKKEKEQSEREKVREFWLQLSDNERKKLIKIEKENVVKKMKEHQRQSCSCHVCGRKRVVIEEELEMLYNAYYHSLEQLSSISSIPEDDNDENYEDLESEVVDLDGFSTGILSVADDFLYNNGTNFLDLVEETAQRQIGPCDTENWDFSGLDHTNNEVLEEGKRMFQVFAARMFEQRILSAYRAKVAAEREQELLLELEEEERLKDERERAKQKAKEKKKKQKLAAKLQKEQEEKERQDSLSKASDESVNPQNGDKDSEKGSEKNANRTTSITEVSQKPNESAKYATDSKLQSTEQPKPSKSKKQSATLNQQSLEEAAKEKQRLIVEAALEKQRVLEEAAKEQQRSRQKLIDEQNAKDLAERKKAEEKLQRELEKQKREEELLEKGRKKKEKKKKGDQSQPKNPIDNNSTKYQDVAADAAASTKPSDISKDDHTSITGSAKQQSSESGNHLSGTSDPQNDADTRQTDTSNGSGLSDQHQVHPQEPLAEHKHSASSSPHIPSMSPNNHNRTFSARGPLALPPGMSPDLLHVAMGMLNVSQRQGFPPSTAPLVGSSASERPHQASAPHYPGMPHLQDLDSSHSSVGRHDVREPAYSRHWDGNGSLATPPGIGVKEKHNHLNGMLPTSCASESRRSSDLPPGIGVNGSNRSSNSAGSRHEQPAVFPASQAILTPSVASFFEQVQRIGVPPNSTHQITGNTLHQIPQMQNIYQSQKNGSGVGTASQIAPPKGQAPLGRSNIGHMSATAPPPGLFKPPAGSQSPVPASPHLHQGVQSWPRKQQPDQQPASPLWPDAKGQQSVSHASNGSQLSPWAHESRQKTWSGDHSSTGLLPSSASCVPKTNPGDSRKNDKHSSEQSYLKEHGFNLPWPTDLPSAKHSWPENDSSSSHKERHASGDTPNSGAASPWADRFQPDSQHAVTGGSGKPDLRTARNSQGSVGGLVSSASAGSIASVASIGAIGNIVVGLGASPTLWSNSNSPTLNGTNSVHVQEQSLSKLDSGTPSALLPLSSTGNLQGIKNGASSQVQGQSIGQGHSPGQGRQAIMSPHGQSGQQQAIASEAKWRQRPLGLGLPTVFAPMHADQSLLSYDEQSDPCGIRDLLADEWPVGKNPGQNHAQNQKQPNGPSKVQGKGKGQGHSHPKQKQQPKQEWSWS